ncbi:hypothetical protein JYQ62_08385 [Nostoc sp. UHCC 0702]|nr:hypothetical protein JYQ62_08385 [Nostoc sp. UHCC 0702]
MGRIEIRLIGTDSDVEAFAAFLVKTSGYITPLKIISEGENRSSRKSTDKLRYMEVDFDSSAMQGE